MENYKPKHAKNDIDLMESFNKKELRMLKVSLVKDIACREADENTNLERLEQYLNLLDKVKTLIEVTID